MINSVLNRIEMKYKKFVDRNENELEYSFRKHRCKVCRDEFIPRLCKDVDICPKCEVKTPKLDSMISFNDD